MDQLQNLNSIFKQKLFRIPDYQRGYSWNIKPQLVDFWEDLMSLYDEKNHYTGVLTLEEVPESKYLTWVEDLWLIKDKGYKPYYLVDGQQRLTTVIILIQCLLEVARNLKENNLENKDDFELNYSSLKDIRKEFLFQQNINNSIRRSYIFGYEKDNPSNEFLKTRIFNEDSSSDENKETLYTLNLENAKKFFMNNLNAIPEGSRKKVLEGILKKISQKLLFNEYVIKNDIDAYVAFETINNRGKRLSDLELLKNRLIYLTTLYRNEEENEIKSIREKINDCWKNVYYQLGKNKKSPLNDDDFLKAHWVVYFKYSRKKGNDYINNLLNEEFTPKKILKKIELKNNLEDAKEERDLNENEQEVEDVEDNEIIPSSLTIKEIESYVLNLKESARHWYNTFNPLGNSELEKEEQECLDKLNRIGIGYFRPLVLSSFLNDEVSSEDRVRLFKEIERFIFVTFRLAQVKSNYRDSEFYNFSRDLYEKKTDVDKIINIIKERIKIAYDESNNTLTSSFKKFIDTKFYDGSGFYGWSGLKYFLYEYELSLMKSRGQKKVDWKLFLKNEKDKISIEHILPQSRKNPYWKKLYGDLTLKKITLLSGSLGNLLPLSKSINSELQDDGFPDKKITKYDSNNQILRNGYKNGSYSEIEVADNQDWTREDITNRGLRLLKFLEKRWAVKLNDKEKISLLHLDFLDSDK